MADVSMEKRMVLALVLAALVLLLWQTFLTPPPSTPTPQPPASDQAPVPGQPAEPAEPGAGPTPVSPPVQPAPPTAVTATMEGSDQDVTLYGEEVVLHLISRGAAVSQVELVHFNAPFDREHRLLMLASPDDLAALLVIDPTAAVPFAQTRYQLTESSEHHAVFEAAWDNGLHLRKTFTLAEDGFHVDLTLEFTNGSPDPLTLSYGLVGSPGLEAETRKATDLAGKVCVDETDIETVVGGKLVRRAPPPYLGSGLSWTAGVNQYFALALIPKEAPVAWALLLPQAGSEQVGALASLSVGPRANLARAKEWVASGDFRPNAVALLLSEPVELSPAEQVSHRFRLFCGPMKDEVLAAYKEDSLPRLVTFGIFSPVSTFILFILKGFYRAVHSYGLAIILLTIVIKAALFPLSHKGQMSMHRMQQLQPKIKELQERHKEDKQKLGQEQLKLMREHGVNPFGGCLPMLLQLPVFIALFRALRSSFELRQRSFLWIDDLSQPDAVATLPFQIPLLGNTVNVLPILWIVSLLVSQKLTPKPAAADQKTQQQQKMMRYFPLFFGVLLYSFPAGLLLYFVSMSVLTIFEQRYVRQRLARLGEPTPRTKSPQEAQRKPSGQTRRKKR